MAQSTRELFISAAEANEDVQLFRTHPQWGPLWTQDKIQADPPVRIEFEHVVVLATVREAQAVRRHKTTWGKLLKIAPLRPDDPLNPLRIVFLYKESSSNRQCYERRQQLKQALGRAGKGLVARAIKLTKEQFLKSVRPEEERVVRTRLGLSPGDFWQACRRGGRWQGVLPL